MIDVKYEISITCIGDHPGWGSEKYKISENIIEIIAGGHQHLNPTHFLIPVSISDYLEISRMADGTIMNLVQDKGAHIRSLDGAVIAIKRLDKSCPITVSSDINNADVKQLVSKLSALLKEQEDFQNRIEKWKKQHE